MTADNVQSKCRRAETEKQSRADARGQHEAKSAVGFVVHVSETVYED